MTDVDDSSLFHASTYDPVKARAYYLANRKLKGRRRTTATATSPGRGGRRPTSALTARSGGIPNRSKTKSRQDELRAQKEALQKRLDRLREALSELVEAAKKRSGGDPNKSSKDSEKDKAPETKADKADRNEAEKAEKPLTAKQKTEKAKKAKEAYEKEHPNTLSQDVEILREQVKDIQAKIQKAVEDARERMNKADSELQANESVRPNVKNNSNDGPQGR